MSFLPDTECICGHSFPKHLVMSNSVSSKSGGHYFVMSPCSDKDTLYGLEYECNCEYFEEYYGDRNNE